MANEFDFGFSQQFPEIDWSFGLDPSLWQTPMDFSWLFPQDFGIGFDPAWLQSDPLALPTFTGNDAFQPAFLQQPGLPQVGGFGMPPGIGMVESPQTLSDALGFAGSAAPQMGVPTAPLPAGGDPMVNLMGTPEGQGAPPVDLSAYLGGTPDLMGGGGNPFADMAPSPIATGGYGLPGAGGGQIPAGPLPGLGGAGYMQPEAAQTPTLADLQRQVLQGQLTAQQRAGEPKPTWEKLATLAAALGPTAVTAAGLGLQAANRPQRNPLEDELIRAKIASTGLQDTLAKDRLAFEREQAAAQLEAQQAMQSELLASRKPGGQPNVEALLRGNPQLAALYQALTQRGTSLASGAGTPEFDAQVEQVAQVEIAELQRQAQQQIAQAQELAVRQGINPANIIAEIQQRLLQESAKARANARQVLVQQIGAQMQPGTQAFNTIGGLFGNLFQVPSVG